MTPLLWGPDIGLIWTTFRVSCTSWVLFLSALVDVAPQWSGLVYGAFFGIPLVLAVLFGPLGGTDRFSGSPPLRSVQSAGLALLVALPTALIAYLYAI
ncbi:hypothetical protein [Sphaerisporangium fuscum]|uniref:hypothetical protein n=1 Tax=Sphaerisporangium fuscum TaxID=2835868 RepID=UPI001BDDC5C4|nr:hypothetical protein [Sphaerisporangium fuscum]